MKSGSQPRYFFVLLLSNLMVGLLPLFWNLLREVETRVVLQNRCLWVFLLLAPLLGLKSSYKEVIETIRRDGIYLLLSTFFVFINWYTYLYAVNNGRVIEASLAYFLSPLFIIFLSACFLKEKISILQKVAIAFAFISVAFLIFSKHLFPTLSLVIGGSFALYGLMGRKLSGTIFLRITFETFVISLALFFLSDSPLCFVKGFLNSSSLTQSFHLISAVVTIIPFYMLHLSIQRLPFMVVGIFSFLVPTLIFLEGIFYFKEPLDREQLLAILGICLGLIFYMRGLVVQGRKLTSSSS